MDGTKPNNPQFIFFRKWPANINSCPSLASSLQHLETSLQLISIYRYPHALVTCASAIESALGAVSSSNKINTNFDSLLKFANGMFRPSDSFTQSDLDEFRRKRNKIIHSGFSPKDDELSVVLLLKTGYPFLEKCYQHFFIFPLRKKDEEYGGLLPEIEKQFDLSLRIYSKAKEIKNISFRYCFIPLAHLIRHRTTILPDWQEEGLNNGGFDVGWEFKYKQREHLFYHFSTAWYFDCPICGDSESFVCELDNDELDKKKIAIIRGLCVNCNLAIPANLPYLADDLFHDQIDRDLPRILKEYGIV